MPEVKDVNKVLYTATCNWYGEKHDLSTYATSEAKAKQNMLFHLAKKINKPVQQVNMYFKDRQDAFIMH